jgi:glycosyltransferase involved in cell wall biosynthesis
MNIIFLTMSQNVDIKLRGIYPDLLRKFVNEGHRVFIVSPRERRLGLKTELKKEGNVTYLGVKTLNLQKCSIVEKGLGQVLVESQYKRAIKKFLANQQFDLILYSTPPITFPKVIAFLKGKNPLAKTYLLLKDIFPQNAVDIGMMSTTGLKGVLYRFFRKKEKKLYALSDFIGCMSPANVDYVLNHNPEIAPSRVEVAPNSIELVVIPFEYGQNSGEKIYIREKYGIPTNKPIFIYGGNLGKPQGIDYLIKCLDANKYRQDCYFVVVGNGTEYNKIKEWYVNNRNTCVKLIPRLPVEDYDMLVRSCDVGLIFLDHRFTIPNYPSRLLSYLEYKMPVICATDVNTDIGSIAEENGYGYWCESVKPEDFTALVDKILASDRKAMGEKGYQFLKENYLVDNTYNAIMSHV